MPAFVQPRPDSTDILQRRPPSFPSHEDQNDGKWMALGQLAHQFSVNEYLLLTDAGILHEDDRLELLEGRIVDMPLSGSSHASAVNRLLATLVNLFQSRAIVSVQNPVHLSDHSEPQPDLMLLRPRDDFYAERHPIPEDVLLLIEVAETSREYDQQVKIPLYAQSGIPEVWLINIPDQCVEVYRTLSGDKYETILILRGQQTLSPQQFPDVRFTVTQLLGQTQVER